MRYKEIIKQLTPPLAWSFLKNIKGTKSGWDGPYSSWEEVQKRCSGYDQSTILEKVSGALLKVKNGTAAYERDSVLFDKIEYSWPLLTGLMLSAQKNHGELKVCDFGGSLGSTYFQNQKFLKSIQNFSWNVIEQESFVKEGKKHFEDERLKFYKTIEECYNQEQPNTLVISNTLQYLERPYETLEKLLNFRFKGVILDNLAISSTGETLTRQTVPPEIYKASYPCWLLDKKKILKALRNRNYYILEDFESSLKQEMSINPKISGKLVGMILLKEEAN